MSAPSRLVLTYPTKALAENAYRTLAEESIEGVDEVELDLLEPVVTLHGCAAVLEDLRLAISPARTGTA